MKIHKIKGTGYLDWYTLCKIVVYLPKAGYKLTSTEWDNITCKRCLKMRTK